MNHIEWRAIAISELIDLLYLLNSDAEFTSDDFQQRILVLSEGHDIQPIRTAPNPQYSKRDRIAHINSGSKRAKNATDDIDQAINALGTASMPHWLNGELINAIALITDSPQEVAALRLHYQFARPGDIDFKRRMATASRFIRRLYKKLANEIAK